MVEDLLPAQLWVVSTDYSNWALVCTTSVSLGGGQPAQVCRRLQTSVLRCTGVAVMESSAQPVSWHAC